MNTQVLVLILSIVLCTVLVKAFVRHFGVKTLNILAGKYEKD